MHPPLSAEPPTKISKRGAGAWTGSQFLEGVAGKEAGDLFRGKVCSFQGGTRKPMQRGDCLNRRDLNSLQIKGGLAKKRQVVFLRWGGGGAGGEV